MSDEVVWGVADFLCQSCGSTLLLVSPHLDSAETNLTGQSAATCTSCGRRTPARDLPQAHQSQIAGRLRLLLEDDEFLFVSKALNTFMAVSSNPDRSAAGLVNAAVDATSSAAKPGSTSLASPSTSTEESPGEALRPTEITPGEDGSTTEEVAIPVDTSSYQLVAKLGAAEATLLSAVPELAVGQIVANRKRDPNFSVVRLRIPIVEPAFFTEVAAELVRYKSSGRRNSLGFSLDEIDALRRGMSARRDIILTRDSQMNTVGLLRFYRMKNSQVAAVEVYRRRTGPRKFGRPQR